MLPRDKGRYRAHVLDAGCQDTGKNELTTVILKFGLDSIMADGDWQELDDDFDIIAYCYLEKKNGDLNDFQIDALKDSFSWDGANPFWFEDNLGNLPNVQVSLDFETYEGKERLRVQFLNAYDSEQGGIKHAAPDTRSAILAKLGSKLRAHGGAPPKPSTAPVGAPVKTPPKQKPDASSTEAGTWAAFMDWGKTEGMDDMAIQKAYFTAINNAVGHEKTDTITPDEWTKISPGLPF